MQEKLDSIYTIKAISFHTFLFRNLFNILNFGEETYLKKEYMLNTLFQFNPWKVALMKWNKCTIDVIYSLVVKTKWIDSYCLSKLFVLSANGQSQAAVGFSSQSQIATNSQTRDRGPKSPLQRIELKLQRSLPLTQCQKRTNIPSHRSKNLTIIPVQAR